MLNHHLTEMEPNSRVMHLHTRDIFHQNNLHSLESRRDRVWNECGRICMWEISLESTYSFIGTKICNMQACIQTLYLSSSLFG